MYRASVLACSTMLCPCNLFCRENTQRADKRKCQVGGVEDERNVDTSQLLTTITTKKKGFSLWKYLHFRVFL